MANQKHDLNFLNDLDLTESQYNIIHQFATAILNESENLKKDLTKSIRLNVHYINSLSKISCDTQYLNVAASSKGGENLIQIAKDALHHTIHNQKEFSK